MKTPIVLAILIVLFLQIPSIQTINCFTCIDCGDPFNANSPNVTQSPSSCYYCYKLTVYMAYAPSRYIVKECVQTCTEISGMFGGSSVEINCCSSSLCNNALRIYSWKNQFIFLTILNIFAIFSIKI